MARTFISAGLLSQLLMAAAASPMREICGLLFGDLDTIDSIQAAANLADDPATAFEIDPAALIKAHKSARAGGAVMTGHYHSHPSGPARPSECDRAAAEPGKLWLILGGGEARLWLAGQDGFTERRLWTGNNC